MTETTATIARRPVLADYSGAWPFFLLAGAAGVAGILWFPLWFFGAQLLRVWAPRGALRWLRRRGIPEYTDERYGAFIAWLPLVPIVVRIALAFNWLQPFEVLNSRRLDPTPGGEWVAVLDIVLGLAIAASLTGVMMTAGWPRLLALAGFVAVSAIALLVAFRPPFEINGFAAIPLVMLGGLTSQLAIFIENAPQRRARRAARQAARIEDQRIEARERKDRGY